MKYLRYSDLVLEKGVAVRVFLHVELAQNEEPAWWAESPDYPEFSGAAENLKELVMLVRETATIESWGTPVFELAELAPEQDGVLTPSADETQVRLQVQAA